MTILDVATDKLRRRGSAPFVAKPPQQLGSYIDGTNPWTSEITENNAFAIPTFLAGVRLIASTGAALPMHVRVEKDDGTSLPDKSPATAYLRGRPNNEQTRMTLFERLLADEVRGDAFMFTDKAGDGSDQVANLLHIARGRMQVGRAKSGVKVYLMDGEHAMIDYAAGGEIVHVPSFGVGLRGIDIVKAAEQSIALGLSAQEFAAQSLVNGGIPPGIISVDGLLDDEQADAVEARWHKGRNGVRNRLRVAVLSGNAKFQQMNQDAEKLQLMPLRKFQNQEIATLIGTPGHMVGLDTVTTWGSGIAQQTTGFNTFTLTTHLRRFEEAIDQFLLVRELTRRYIKFETAGLLRGTTLERFQSYALGWGRWLSPNDIRRLEDMPPVPGGDEILVGVNLIPLEQIAEQIAAERRAQDPAETSPSTPGQPTREPAR